jgi:hypothetical protein
MGGDHIRFGQVIYGDALAAVAKSFLVLVRTAYVNTMRMTLMNYVSVLKQIKSTLSPTNRRQEMSGAELLLNGVRIIIQILVDAHEHRLTPEVKKEIQTWYDELEQRIADARR